MATGSDTQLAPQQIGDYVVCRVIGEGGMGVVYEAMERLTGRRVALKVLHTDLALSEDVRARFYGEMRILASLEHPSIVRSLASTEVDGKPVMVLEYLEGRTLREELASVGRVPVERAIAIASAVASALSAAHGKDPPVVHRDLKPENLMLLADGSVKVMDFGVAKVLAAKGSATTQVVGTVQYMSPEQAQGGEITPKTDLYSLGLLLYEMLCGAAPFQSASLLLLVRKHCDEPPPPFPDEVKKQVPRDIERLVFALLSKSPEERPRDARAVVEALRGASAATEKIALRPPAPPPGPVIPPPPKKGAPAIAKPPARARKDDTIALLNRFDDRKRWPWIAVAVASCVIAAAAVWVLFFKAPAPAKPKPKPSAAKSEAPVGASATAPAPAPADCDRGDRCARFAPPSLANVDADVLFEESTKQARLVDPNAVLGGALLQNALAGGALDLTRPDAVVTLTYDLPSGGLQVEVVRDQIVVTRFSRQYLDRVSPDVPCPLKRAVDALVAAKFPLSAGTDATLTMGSQAGKSAWSFRTDAESAVIEGPNCAVKSNSAAGR